MKCDFVFRPLGPWPGVKSKRPRRAIFRVGYSKTLDLLNREIANLGSRKAVIQIDLLESEIRLDGLPRSDARPAFQGVIISFESKYGPLRYATDTYNDWKDNIRAIALGLEALRAVDRYGVTRKGEQYTGWKQLPAAISDIADVNAAAEFISRYSGVKADVISKDPAAIHAAFRVAAKKLHPDAGGTAELFDLLVKARLCLEANGGK